MNKQFFAQNIPYISNKDDSGEYLTAKQDLKIYIRNASGQPQLLPAFTATVEFSLPISLGTNIQYSASVTNNNTDRVGSLSVSVDNLNYIFKSLGLKELTSLSFTVRDIYTVNGELYPDAMGEEVITEQDMYNLCVDGSIIVSKYARLPILQTAVSQVAWVKWTPAGVSVAQLNGSIKTIPTPGENWAQQLRSKDGQITGPFVNGQSIIFSSEWCKTVLGYITDKGITYPITVKINENDAQLTIDANSENMLQEVAGKDRSYMVTTTKATLSCDGY